jgi:hypothetical protein
LALFRKVSRGSAAAIIVLSLTLDACGGGKGTLQSSSTIPTTSSHAPMLSDRNALDHMFGRSDSAGQMRRTQSLTTPAVFYHQSVLPSSAATIKNFGIYDWVLLSGNHQMDGVGTINDVATLGLDYNGRVIWEADSQSSQTLGAIRFFYSSGGYFGAWTSGTLNVAQAPTQWDLAYSQALQKDLQWAQNGFPGGSHGGGIRRPISNGAPTGGANPTLTDGEANVLAGGLGYLAGLVGLVGCIATACTVPIVAGLVLGAVAGLVTLIRGQEQVEESNRPPTPIPGPTQSPGGEFYYTGFSGLPPSGPIQSVIVTWVSACDEYGCTSEIMYFWV